MACGCATETADTPTATRPTTTIPVEFLFLDEETCVPCGGSAQALNEAVAMLAAPLAALGAEVAVDKVHVIDEATAEARRFVSSPTIRVAGVDIDPARTEDDCPSCGELAGGASVSCRTWHWRGQAHTSAPVGKIVEAILHAALGDGPSGNSDETDYRMPDNLKRFFAARDGLDGERAAKSCC